MLPLIAESLNVSDPIQIVSHDPFWFQGHPPHIGKSWSSGMVSLYVLKTAIAGMVWHGDYCPFKSDSYVENA